MWSWSDTLLGLGDCNVASWTLYSSSGISDKNCKRVCKLVVLRDWPDGRVRNSILIRWFTKQRFATTLLGYWDEFPAQCVRSVITALLTNEHSSELQIRYGHLPNIFVYHYYCFIGVIFVLYMRVPAVSVMCCSHVGWRGHLQMCRISIRGHSRRGGRPRYRLGMKLPVPLLPYLVGCCATKRRTF